MSLSTMSARDRRALRLGLIILAPALFYIWGVRPFRASLTTTRTEIAAKRELLSRELAAVSAARRNPELQRAADSAMRATAPRLFEGRDDVMATAELVSHLGVVAQEHQVLLEAASTRPTTIRDGGVRALQVEIRAESDLHGVLAFLRALEGSEKLLRVERLDISRSLGTIEDEGVEALSISATIIGFAIPNAGLAPDTIVARGTLPPERGQ
jgi:hypothetical protein